MNAATTPPYIDRLQDLPLTLFIACSVHQRYAVLCTSPAADHDEQALQMAWLKLLAQFFTVKNDAHATRWAALVAEMELITFRAQLIALFKDRLQTMGYNEAIVAALKSFTGYADLNYDPKDSTAAWHRLEIKEKRYKTVYDGLKLELERSRMTATKTGEKEFYKTVMLYNKVYQTRHTVKDITAYEYALMCEELENEN